MHRKCKTFIWKISYLAVELWFITTTACEMTQYFNLLIIFYKKPQLFLDFKFVNIELCSLYLPLSWCLNRSISHSSLEESLEASTFVRLNFASASRLWASRVCFAVVNSLDKLFISELISLFRNFSSRNCFSSFATWSLRLEFSVSNFRDVIDEDFPA